MDHPERQIPILRIPYSDDDKAFLTQAAEGVLDSGMLSMGPNTQAFEESFAGFAGSSHCAAVSNGTAALEVILRAIDVYGRAVIVPTNTFLATALAVMHAGARVIFADSDPATLCLDPVDVKRKLTADVAAVIHVHIGGIVAPSVHEIKAACDERGVALVEDCAHAHGCTLDGKGAGTIGVAGAFSFFPTKVLTTGEGGTIITEDPDLYHRCLMIRNQGKDPERGNHIAYPGHNFRLSELTAVLGLEQMRRAQAIISARQAVAASYDRALADVSAVSPVVLPEGCSSSYYKYVAYLPEGTDRTELKRRLKEEHGVALTGEVYADLCHAEPLWEDYTYCGAPRASGCLRVECGCDGEQSGFPGAEVISQRHICLPLYPGLTGADTEWVVSALAKTVESLGVQA